MLPISIPLQPSGIASEGTYLDSASGANLSAMIEPTGNNKLTPFSSAFSMMDFARSSLSSSQIELPML